MYTLPTVLENILLILQTSTIVLALLALIAGPDFWSWTFDQWRSDCKEKSEE